MYSTGRVAYSSAESKDVKIDSLYLDGTSGRVVANISEQMLSIEAKSGHGLDIKIHSINRVQHHHTRLIPGYVATFGLALIWSSIRIFANGTLQIFTMLGGLGLIMGWAVTRKPTLTIDTEAGDCHVITGNDFSLLKMNTILMKLQKGFSLEEAADGLEILESDAQYPRNSILETNEIPVEVATVARPDSIATFLSSEVAESVTPEPESMPFMDLSIFDAEMPATQTLADTTPSWQDMANERRERLPSAAASSLIERGISNVNDRRGRQETHPMAMFDKYELDLPTGFGNTPQPQQIRAPDSGLLSKMSQHQSGEAGPATMPDLLPSFCSRDGYHNPSEQNHEVPMMDFDGFSSPDSLLGNIDIEGNAVESLVASARKETNPNRKLPVSEATSINQNSRLRKKSSTNNSRLVKRKQAKTQTQRRGRLVPSIGNAVRDSVSSLTNRIINSLEETAQQNPSLRERADEAQQGELEDFRNLAQSNGGPFSDEKVRELEANARRRRAIMEQNEQEFADLSNELSFTELVDSETHENSTAGKGGLPRIDR